MGVLILRNISLKLKTVVDNAILLNRFTSSKNISDESKGMNRDDFEQKVNVGIFRRNESCPEKIVALPIFICNEQKKAANPCRPVKFINAIIQLLYR